MALTAVYMGQFSFTAEMAAHFPSALQIFNLFPAHLAKILVFTVPTGTVPARFSPTPWLVLQHPEIPRFFNSLIKYNIGGS
jgi:hypothetical protein